MFPNGTGGLTGGGGTSIGVESSINIVNDQLVDQDAVDTAALLGLTLTLGQTTDGWSAASETAGEFMPSFVDWNVEYVYSTSNPFSSTDYVSVPPPNPDLILFAISQDDANIYFVFGEVTAVPEPGFELMLGAGIVGSLRTALAAGKGPGLPPSRPVREDAGVSTARTIGREPVPAS